MVRRYLGRTSVVVAAAGAVALAANAVLLSFREYPLPRVVACATHERAGVCLNASANRTPGFCSAARPTPPQPAPSGRVTMPGPMFGRGGVARWVRPWEHRTMTDTASAADAAAARRDALVERLFLEGALERPCGNPGHAALTGVEQTADQPLSVSCSAPTRRWRRVASMASMGRKSGQPTWSSRCSRLLAMTVTSQPPWRRAAATSIEVP